MRLTICCLLAYSLLSCGPNLPEPVALAYAELPERVDFNQHIRPILSDRCWSCHGPDADARQAELRLDLEEDARRAADFIADRILSEDPGFVMPTPESKMSLSDREKALLVRWIEEGAEWKAHWAFLPITDPLPPENPRGYPEALTPVDGFVNARLSGERLAPNDRAPAELLLRRLYQDLTGLPPSPTEIDAWLADTSETHYRATVERLLETDAHAERLTMEWLDVARYADSHGLHADGIRNSYPYRDWVIGAFRQNLPYDEFIGKQIAGDLLPEASRDDHLATAFLRMHPSTGEGGAIDEEFRLGYVFDRVNTVATGLLGLTMDCSRCHDHKFDPLSQEEYYAFSAFFNNVDELGMMGDDGEFGPYVSLADARTDSLVNAYTARLKALDAERQASPPTAAELTAFNGGKSGAPRPALALDFKRKDEAGTEATESVALVEDETRGQVVEFDEGWDYVTINGQAQIDPHEPFSAAVWVKTEKRDSSLEQAILATSSSKNTGWRGLEMTLDNENYLTVRLIRRLPTDLIEVRTTDSLKTGEWYHVGFTYDGTGAATAVNLFVNGAPAASLVLHDELTGTFNAVDCESWRDCDRLPLRLGQAHRTFTGDNAVFRGRMDELRLYQASVSPVEMARLAGQAAGPNATKLAARQQSDRYQKLTREMRATLAKRWPLQDTLARMMVMREMKEPRPTYVLQRGAYDAPGKRVEPTTPASVLPWPETLPRNRAGLATWLFADENPLTARVVVNRYWQLLFGQGLVTTPHDFGSQGSLPTHPELLDYLASRLQENWDIRELLRTIVLSDTYRRGSTPTVEQRQKDPENLLLARGARYRMPAELIRDNALAASGLLNRRVGGPSVFPFQPAGLWSEKSNFSAILDVYRPGSGDDLYRRTMYTFIRRTSPPPFLTNFDASGRDACIVKRSETNTPLQALNLLNDPQFVEAARVLAARVRGEEAEITDQLGLAFRLVTGRSPESRETEVLHSLYRDELARFTAAPARADSLLRVGEYPVPTDTPVVTAALASVANVLFSLDGAYVKQ